MIPRISFVCDRSRLTLLIGDFWINLRTPLMPRTFSEYHGPDDDPPLLEFRGWRLRARRLR